MNMTPGEISYWQTKLNPVLIQCGQTPLVIDGRYGPKTRAAVEWVQVITGVHVDGDIGPETVQALVSLTDRYPVAVGGKRLWHAGIYRIDSGRIPDPMARCSTFGGPDDVNDRYLGQANIPDVDAPCDLVRYKAMTDAGLWRSDALMKTQWPEVTDEQGQPRRAGTSWALDPRSYYAAMRQVEARRRGRTGDNCAKILVIRGDKACCCYLTDYGPADRTYCDLDLSPGAYDYLGMTYRGRARVFWAPDEMPIGPA